MHTWSVYIYIHMHAQICIYICTKKWIRPKRVFLRAPVSTCRRNPDIYICMYIYMYICIDSCMTPRDAKVHIPDQAKHHQERAARCDRVAGLHEISALTMLLAIVYIYI